MIAIVHSIYSQSVHAPARDAGLMDNDAERYCSIIGTVYIVVHTILFCHIEHQRKMKNLKIWQR